jgi:hypothetical protein
MPPWQLAEQHPLKAAAEAATRLSDLLQDPEVSQQLQQPPAAVPTQQQQATTLTEGGSLILMQLNDLLLEQLHAPLPSTSAAATGTGTAAIEPGRLLGTMLRHKAACGVGSMLAWTLQRPEQLQLKHMVLFGSCEADSERPYSPSVADLWGLCSACLGLMGSLLEERVPRQATCRAETLAAAMLQQLEQSGECHRWKGVSHQSV